jgi:hypothetical protein
MYFYKIKWVFLINFFIYCISTPQNPLHNNNLLNNKEYCIKRDSIKIFSFNANQNVSYTFLIQNQKLEWYRDYQNRYKQIENRLNLIRDFLLEHKECKDSILFVIKEDLYLYLRILNLYYDTLEKELIIYVNQKNLYNGDKIIQDFKENKKAILESYKNFIESILKEIREDQNFAKEHYQWYEVYSIVVFELFYQLPENFKKEWFKKFSY